MKLADLYESTSQFFKTIEEVEDWLKSVGIKNYNIDPKTLIVDVNDNVNLDHQGFTRLPVKFGHIEGYFRCGFCKNLISMVGSPDYCTEFYSFENCNVRTFEGVTPIVGTNFYCFGNPIKSLKDIHKHVKEIGARVGGDGGRFFATETNIRSNVLGLLKIKGVTLVELNDEDVEEILNKYLPEGDILDCIDELTDAGFEEYAKL